MGIVDFTSHVRFPPAFQHLAGNRAVPESWEFCRRFQKHPRKSRKSANLDSLEAKTPPGSLGPQCPSLRRWGGFICLSQGGTQWEHRLVTVSQRALSCDYSQARQSDTNENTHTHTVPSNSKTFSHAVPGWPEGQLVMGTDLRPPPPWKLHPAPFTPGLATRPPLPASTFQGKEIAEQCGRSEDGHRAQGPVLGRLWALTLLPQHPSLSVGFSEGWPSSDLSPYLLAIPTELKMADNFPPFPRFVPSPCVAARGKSPPAWV